MEVDKKKQALDRAERKLQQAKQKVAVAKARQPEVAARVAQVAAQLPAQPPALAHVLAALSKEEQEAARERDRRCVGFACVRGNFLCVGVRGGGRIRGEPKLLSTAARPDSCAGVIIIVTKPGALAVAGTAMGQVYWNSGGHASHADQRVQQLLGQRGLVALLASRRIHPI